jgi:hypothetical protein
MSIHELRTLGETHLGYVFVTFASQHDAKRALVMAQMSFEPFVYDADRHMFAVDLLKDDFHMDFDEDFQVRHASRVLTADSVMSERIEDLKADLIEHERCESLT